MTISFLIFISVFLGLLFFLIHELRRSPGPMQSGRAPKWMKLVRVTLVCVLLFFVSCLIWGFFIEPNRLVVRPVTLSLSKWPTEPSGLRIAVISDVHTGGPF